MNLLRSVYPLWLRRRLGSRFINARAGLPETGGTPHRLALAPTSLQRLSPTDVAHKHVAWLGFYELELSRRLARIAKKPGGLLVDVGANAGYFSCLWAALSPANRVIAYEASPRNIAMLRENVAAAKLDGRIAVHQLALGREPGRMGFDLGPDDQTGWGGLTLTSSDNAVVVEVQRLDDLIDSESFVTALKIDVEGADAWVLEGAETLLRAKRIAHVFFECNRPRMALLEIDPQSPLAFLRGCGYRVRPFVGEFEFVATPLEAAAT